MNNFRVGQVVRLKEEFKTPRCKKGLCPVNGDYGAYTITKIKRVNASAYNMGTFTPCILRLSEIE